MKRLTRMSDMQAIYAIYMHPTVIPFLWHEQKSIEDFEPIFEDLINRKTFYVYEIDEEIASFYHLSRHAGRSSHVAYLGTFAVNPKLHRQGMAFRILSEQIAELRELGLKRMELIVESDNHHAIALYKKLGFQIEGTLRKFYKRAADAEFLDDHYMGLLLDE